MTIMKEMMMTMVRNISFVNPLAMPKLMSDDTMRKMQISPRIYLNSDMMVGSGQPRSSTSSTVEFWSENEKQRFTWDFDHIQLFPNIQFLKGQVEQKNSNYDLCKLTFIPNVPSGWEMCALQRECLARKRNNLIRGDFDSDEHGNGDE